MASTRQIHEAGRISTRTDYCSIDLSRYPAYEAAYCGSDDGDDDCGSLQSEADSEDERFIDDELAQDDLVRCFPAYAGKDDTVASTRVMETLHKPVDVDLLSISGDSVSNDTFESSEPPHCTRDTEEMEL